MFFFSPQERRGSEARGQRAAGRVAARDHGGRRGGHVGQRQAAGRAHDRAGRGRRRGPGVGVLVHVRGTGAVRLQQGHAAGRDARVRRPVVVGAAAAAAAVGTAGALAETGVHIDGDVKCQTNERINKKIKNLKRKKNYKNKCYDIITLDGRDRRRRHLRHRV